MDHLTRQFEDAGLHKYASALSALARPALRMSVVDVTEDDWPPKTSKLGGAPDVPANFEWPEWGGVPLSFIGQVNLTDTARFDEARELPQSGVLSFFYHPEQAPWGFDPKDRGGARVYWFQESSALQGIELPTRLPDYGQFPAGRLSFRELVTLAPSEARDVKALGLTSSEEDAYFALWEAHRVNNGEGAQHQLLGNPDPIQDEMQLECQLVTNGIYCGDGSGYGDPRRAALESGASDWQLLAQFDSDDDVDMMWGDVGMLYFWIKAQDLAARDFDRTWMIFQCS